MAVTRLERKGRKNKSRAKARVATIKRLNQAPVLKNVDVEAIKAEFAKTEEKPKGKKKEKVTKAETKPVEETKATKDEVVTKAAEASQPEAKASEDTEEK